MNWTLDFKSGIRVLVSRYHWYTITAIAGLNTRRPVGRVLVYEWARKIRGIGWEGGKYKESSQIRISQERVSRLGRKERSEALSSRYEFKIGLEEESGGLY